MWDPNDENSYAHLSVEASRHGGPLQYIEAIETDARNDESKKWIKIGTIAVSAAVFFGYRLYPVVDEIKAKIQVRKIQKEKANRAKVAIINSCSKDEEDAPDE